MHAPNSVGACQDDRQTSRPISAAREASGAHPYGRYLEEFEVGAVYKHWPAKTVTEADDHLFCLLTMNHHPLHINDVYAAQSQQGRNVVVGPLRLLASRSGMSVSDISGKAIANLATEELSHPAPVFHGDTLFAETEVLEVKPNRAPSPTAGRSRSTPASSTRTATWWPSSSGSCWSRSAKFDVTGKRLEPTRRRCVRVASVARRSVDLARWHRRHSASPVSLTSLTDPREVVHVTIETPVPTKHASCSPGSSRWRS